MLLTSLSCMQHRSVSSPDSETRHSSPTPWFYSLLSFICFNICNRRKKKLKQQTTKNQQATHSSWLKEVFCKEFAKLPKKVSGAERKGIRVAALRVITEIGHILHLKEMDHQNPAPPPTHPGLPLATPIRSAWSIPTSLPNSLTNTLILYVHVSFHLFHMLFMPFTFIGRGCEMTPHIKNLLCFQAAWVDQEGNAEQPEVCGFSWSPGWTQPRAKCGEHHQQVFTSAGLYLPNVLHSSFVHRKGKKRLSSAGFMGWLRVWRTQCPNKQQRKANGTWRRNKGKQCSVGKAVLSHVITCEANAVGLIPHYGSTPQKGAHRLGALSLCLWEIHSGSQALELWPEQLPAAVWELMYGRCMGAPLQMAAGHI